VTAGWCGAPPTVQMMAEGDTSPVWVVGEDEIVSPRDSYSERDPGSPGRDAEDTYDNPLATRQGPLGKGASEVDLMVDMMWT
jgi:hypothetical protein